ncbi:hypothetical protein IWQ60_001514 [Tieghemiomyces parasiticus]|uniref:Uncharacterized protein n=1 Tax=Tieghemiomyces parasiticus TaxID=78921 RepID=A0A9W8AJS5_9FUNG|nr:hypothetical protein IWQ60_001514 [Tieghemiomyces parasiticus]
MRISYAVALIGLAAAIVAALPRQFNPRDREWSLSSPENTDDIEQGTIGATTRDEENVANRQGLGILDTHLVTADNEARQLMLELGHLMDTPINLLTLFERINATPEYAPRMVDRRVEYAYPTIGEAGLFDTLFLAALEASSGPFGEDIGQLTISVGQARLVAAAIHNEFVEIRGTFLVRDDGSVGINTGEETPDNSSYRSLQQVLAVIFDLTQANDTTD